MPQVIVRPQRARTAVAALPAAAPRWFAIGLLVLGAALIVNTLLGPLVADVIRYPYSATVRNEALGLEVVSLVLVAPLAIAAGWGALRRWSAAPVVALAPAAYTAYMFVQYVAGPQYVTHVPQMLAHIALFSLSAALLLRAWSLTSAAALPAMPPAALRRWGVVLIGLGAFVLARWIEALAAMPGSAPLDPAYAGDPGMYWTIFLLDVGVIVPAAVVAGLALRLGRPWARTALYALVGWFALVPPSVTAMAVVKHLRNDPFANAADTVVFAVGAVVFAAIAVALYRPVLRRRS